MGKPDVKVGVLFGMAAILLIFASSGSSTAAAQYWAGEGSLNNPVSNCNPIFRNYDYYEDECVVSETTTEPNIHPSQQPTTEEEVGHQVDQDLDCIDYYMQGRSNFNVTEADERYGLDADNDGIACEVHTAANGTEIQVDPEPAAGTNETGEGGVPQQEPQIHPGNAVDAVQIFGATYQECLAHAYELGFVLIQQEAVESGNTEVIEAIDENPEVVEEAMNNTGVTEEIITVITDNIEDILTNQTTVVEVVEEEVVPELEDNVEEIEEEIIEVA